MTHYRIIASVWSLFGVVGVVCSAVECVRLMRLGDGFTDGNVVSTLIGLIFCALAASTALGLFRVRRWDRIIATVLTVLLCLYCLSFLVMVGLEFGIIVYLMSWLGVAFAAYSFVVIWIMKPQTVPPK